MKREMITEGLADAPAEIGEDQAAEFAALEMGATESAAAPAEAAPGAAPGLTLADELAGLAGAVLAVAGPMFPSVKAIYTPEVLAAASEAVAAVCVKHGWLSGGVMGEYAEELTCLMVCGPLALATVAAVKSDLAKAKKPAPGPAQAASEAVAAPGEAEPAAVDHSKPCTMARG